MTRLRSPGRSLTSSERDILSHSRQVGPGHLPLYLQRRRSMSRFKNVVNHQARGLIAESDTLEIADSLGRTFNEGRDILEYASRDQLRARFNAWAVEAAEVENPRRVKHPYGLYGIPRYGYINTATTAAVDVISASERQSEKGFKNELHLSCAQAVLHDRLEFGRGFALSLVLSWRLTECSHLAFLH